MSNPRGYPVAPSSDGNIREALTTSVEAISVDVDSVVTGLDVYAPLASPSLTGTPTVPTAAPGTNSTQAASTAYADAAVAAVPAPTVTDFSSSGTYTVPAWAKTLKILAWSSLGGAASGRRGAPGTARYGGGGGSSGAYMEREISVAELAALPGWAGTLIVTIGAKGLGGAAVTTDDTNGNPGTNGGTTTVQATATGNPYILYAVNGRGGSGGTATSGLGGISVNGFSPGTAGAAASIAGTPGPAGFGTITGGGGGAGGSITSADVALAGGNGGLGSQGWGDPSGSQNAGGAGGAAGTAGSAPAAALFPAVPRGGAGGGGASTTGVGAAGASGGAGGGGGASANGHNSGPGGDGQAGFIRIIAFG